MNRFIILILFFAPCFLWSQEIAFSNHRADVIEYELNITFGKELQEGIDVVEKIFIGDWENRDSLVFDLQSMRTLHGRGMHVSEVTSKSGALNFTQQAEHLLITGFKENELYEFVEVKFNGKPEDGLVIGNNRFGAPTAFGDNWPNRAHQWFVCNDYPSDKALIHYVVNVPEQYEVIANGHKIRVSLENGRKEFEYRTHYVLPTKVMVIGVADFSIKNYNSTESGIPVSAWVYPENEKEGFYDMELAVSILEWFEKKVGEYPYDKLANVQSTTRFGGMENASCIFYDEKAIDGKRSMEALLAHEIAHQWFGNSASEKDFSHIWLSEGFATFMTNMYILETKGEHAFYKQLDKDRMKIIALNKRDPRPVIDDTADLMSLLNANSYQKGGWILNMLKHEIGEELFWEVVRRYYDQFSFSNATSDDFIEVAQEVSGKNLSQFFEQWLTFPSIPKLDIQVKKRGKGAYVKIYDKGQFNFRYDLEIDFILSDDSVVTEIFKMDKPITFQKISFNSRVHHWEIDARHKILFEKY